MADTDPFSGVSYGSGGGGSSAPKSSSSGDPFSGMNYGGSAPAIPVAPTSEPSVPASSGDDSSDDTDTTYQPGAPAADMPGPKTPEWGKMMEMGFKKGTLEGYNLNKLDKTPTPVDLSGWIKNGASDLSGAIGSAIGGAGIVTQHLAEHYIPGATGRKPFGPVSEQEKSAYVDSLKHLDIFGVYNDNPYLGTHALISTKPRGQQPSDVETLGNAAGSMVGDLNYRYGEPLKKILQGSVSADMGDVGSAIKLQKQGLSQFGGAVARHPGNALMDALPALPVAGKLLGGAAKAGGRNAMAFAARKNLGGAKDMLRNQRYLKRLRGDIERVGQTIRDQVHDIRKLVRAAYDQLPSVLQSELMRGSKLREALEFRDGGHAYRAAMQGPFATQIAVFKATVDALNNHMSDLLIKAGVITRADYLRARYGSMFIARQAEAGNLVKFEDLVTGPYRRGFLKWAERIDTLPDTRKPTYFTLRSEKAGENFLHQIYNGIMPQVHANDMMDHAVHSMTGRKSNQLQPWHIKNAAKAAEVQVATGLTYLHLKELFEQWANDPTLQRLGAGATGRGKNLPKGIGELNLDDFLTTLNRFASGDPQAPRISGAGSIFLPEQVARYLGGIIKGGPTLHPALKKFYDVIIKKPTELSALFKLGFNPMFMPLQRAQDTLTMMMTMKGPRDVALTAAAFCMSLTDKGKALVPHFMQYDHSASALVPQFSNKLARLAAGAFTALPNANFALENIGQNQARRWFALREMMRAFMEADPATRKGVVGLLTNSTNYQKELEAFVNASPGLMRKRILPKLNKLMGNYGPLHGVESIVAGFFPFYRWTIKHSTTLAHGMVTEYPLTVAGSILVSRTMHRQSRPADMPDSSFGAGDIPVYDYAGNRKMVEQSGKKYPVNANHAPMSQLTAAPETIKGALEWLHILPQLDERRNAILLTPAVQIGGEFATGKTSYGSQIRSSNSTVTSRGRVYDANDIPATFQGGRLVNRENGPAVDPLASFGRNFGGQAWRNLNKTALGGKTEPSLNSTPFNPDPRRDRGNFGAPVPSVQSKLPWYEGGVDTMGQHAQTMNKAAERAMQIFAAKNAMRDAAMSGFVRGADGKLHQRQR